MQATASALLKSEKVLDHSTIVCAILPFNQWECVEVPVANDDQVPAAPASSTSLASSNGDWWKRMPRTGFSVEMSDSMNGGKSFLPYKCRNSILKGGTAELFALPAIRKRWNVFPPVGMVCGGTRIDISGDLFHFDTPDAVVSLQWRVKFFEFLQPERA